MNLGDDGYLVDPDEAFGSYAHPDVKAYSAINEIPCLGLLGEPGIGKSTAIQEVIETARQANKHVIAKNLRQYSSEERLIRDVFESKTYQQWIDGDSALELFLDSLDESLLRMGTVVPILCEQFRKAPVNRLRLRIACRTAEWPQTLEEVMLECWGKKACATYELVPLRRRDVITAAETEGIDSPRFLDEVKRLRAQSLAIKPVTLRFLLKTYRRNARLSDTEADLYQQGCRLLCEESPERKDSRTPYRYDPDQRFAVAKRIAAVTVFSNRYAIWTGADEGDVPDEDVAIGLLTSGYEVVNGKQFPVDQLAVLEALNTGLFSSRGPARMGWAHLTYSDFLAATYLIDRGTPSGQILALITDNLSGQCKVIPQLHEVASRIATANKELFDAIIKHDPVVLLRSDVATAGETQRFALVQALLDLCHRGEFPFRWLDYYDRLRHLRHSSLGEQLRPYLADAGSNIDARLLALHITESCAVSGLTSELVGVAFDSSAHLELRLNAIDAIGATADDKTKARLIELCSENSGHASRLRGAALMALWPRYISAEQLFEIIDIPTTDSEINRYSSFISGGVTKNLGPEHLPAALRWVIRQTWSRHSGDTAYCRLLDKILFSAWEYMDALGVLPLFAQAIHARILLDYGHLVDSSNKESNAFLNDTTKRRKLLCELVPLMKDSERYIICLIEQRTGIAKPEDLPWLLDQLDRETKSELFKVWGILCKSCFDLRNVHHVELIIDLAAHSPAVQKAFEWYLQPVALDSPEAQAGHDEYEREREWRKTDVERPQLNPPLDERIPLWLKRSEAGEPEIWWHLVRELTLTPESHHYHDEWEPDITAFPGWQSADEGTRARILEAARQYILHCKDRWAEWMESYEIENSGYQALRLLLIFDQVFVNNLEASNWVNWIAALLDYPRGLSEEEAEKYHRPLIAMIYRLLPESFVVALKAGVRREAVKGPITSCLERVVHILDDRLCTCLRVMIDDGTINENCVRELIVFLVAHRDPEVVSMVWTQVTEPLPADGDQRNRLVAAVAALGVDVSAEHWPRLWNVFQSSPDFGRSVVGIWTSEHRRNTVLTKLSDNQLADLYIWVSRQFPYSEDPRQMGYHGIGAREQIADWRDQYLLQLLKNRGTFSACAALVSVQAALPEVTWLRFTVAEAIAIARRKNWRPPQPPEVLRLVSDRDSRIVSDPSQLVTVIMESLNRLQSELHDKTPAVRDVWDHSRNGNAWQPIDENALSDYVARFLNRDISARGIVVNREVEIRRGNGQPGETTDIHVDAVVEAAGGVRDVITCIIEAKGCWHAELKTALQTQLVDRYLHKNQCRQGLYLVGWFMCEAWDKDDSRKKATPDMTIEEVRSLFSAQAALLSGEDLTVKSFILDLSLDPHTPKQKVVNAKELSNFRQKPRRNGEKRKRSNA
jgi:hypothetical protein